MKKHKLIGSLCIAMTAMILFWLSINVDKEFMVPFVDNHDSARTFLSTSGLYAMILALFIFFNDSKQHV